jgi:signal transduction histidine kinase
LAFGDVADYFDSDSPRQMYLSHLKERYHALLAVPLTVKDNVYGGIVLYYPEPRQFSAEEIDLAVSFANQAALAIENTRLFAQAEQAAILEERQRLARDLHDSVTQSLYGVTMFAEAAARLLESGETAVASGHLREVRETGQEALQEMRLLLFELRPPILEKEGLAMALQIRLETVEGRSGLETEFETDGVAGLPPDVEEGLYRIAQEALNNTLKHAHAQKVTAYLGQKGDRVILEIADDGLGFDPTMAQGKGGLGLEGMEARAAAIGGRLIIKSHPEQGTMVRVEVDIAVENLQYTARRDDR